MRTTTLSVLSLVLMSHFANAQLRPEMATTATLAAPADSWFMIHTGDGSYIFDGDSGEMQGLISNNWYTPAFVAVPARKEVYGVESWHSRGVTGVRTDVLTVVDMTDLTTKTEIDIPDKVGALSFRNHIGIMGDDRHVAVFNMTPAQSVSIVDVVDRQFDGEISTPGCAIIMPTGNRDFMMMCGDGRLQLIQLDENGKESNRSRTEPFFDVETDPVIDKPMKTADGYALVSYEGLVYDVTVNGSRINVGKPWSPLTEEDIDEEWRPGGPQPFAVHRNSSILYMLMHQGKIDTHYEDGTEVWLIDLKRKKKVGVLKLDAEASHILSSQEEDPRLYVFDGERHPADAGRHLHIYDGHSLHLVRTIENPGPGPGLLQTLTQYD